MKKLALLLLTFAACSTPVQQSDFNGSGFKDFDDDYAQCAQVGRDFKARFGYANQAIANCMYQKGYRLKGKDE